MFLKVSAPSFFVAWTDRKPFKVVIDIMLHPQIGSEGTKLRSDFFHSSLKYIFGSLWKSKDKDIVCHMSHTHIAGIILEGFLHLYFFVAWTDRKPFKVVIDIMLHLQIGSEGTEFRPDFWK